MFSYFLMVCLLYCSVFSIPIVSTDDLSPDQSSEYRKMLLSGEYIRNEAAFISLLKDEIEGEDSSEAIEILDYYYAIIGQPERFQTMLATKIAEDFGKPVRREFMLALARTEIREGKIEEALVLIAEVLNGEDISNDLTNAARDLLAFIETRYEFAEKSNRRIELVDSIPLSGKLSVDRPWIVKGSLTEQVAIADRNSQYMHLVNGKKEMNSLRVSRSQEYARIAPNGLALYLGAANVYYPERMNLRRQRGSSYDKCDDVKSVTLDSFGNIVAFDSDLQLVFSLASNAKTTQVESLFPLRYCQDLETDRLGNVLYLDNRNKRLVARARDGITNLWMCQFETGDQVESMTIDLLGTVFVLNRSKGILSIEPDGAIQPVLRLPPAMVGISSIAVDRSGMFYGLDTDTKTLFIFRIIR